MRGRGVNNVKNLLRPHDRHLGEAVDVDPARRVLAHLQGWARGPPAEQVGNALLVDLERRERHGELAARPRFGVREDLHRRPRDDARQLELRLRAPAPVGERPVDRVGLSRSRLAIGEHCAVVSLEHGIDHASSHDLVGLRLGRVAAEHAVERNLAAIVIGFAQQDGSALFILHDALRLGRAGRVMVGRQVGVLVDEWAHARHDFDAAGLNRVTHAADGEEAQNELCGVLSDRLHACRPGRSSQLLYVGGNHRAMEVCFQL